MQSDKYTAKAMSMLFVTDIENAATIKRVEKLAAILRAKAERNVRPASPSQIVTGHTSGR